MSGSQAIIDRDMSDEKPYLVIEADDHGAVFVEFAGANGIHITVAAANILWAEIDAYYPMKMDSYSVCIHDGDNRPLTITVRHAYALQAKQMLESAVRDAMRIADKKRRH